ncbi:MAG TPA: SpoIIE family protein phosphatase [Terriglobia bacterium]|nr:SpoIIE family protein phosphatase [Terriglobia bacterium]
MTNIEAESVVEILDGCAPRLLIADDQPDVLAALQLLLKGEGYQIRLVTSPAAVIESLEISNYDLLLMDLNYARDTTSGREGLDLLARVQAIDRTLPVVVMTAWSSVSLAVEAMRRGVRDFVQKPWENAQLLSTLETQIEWARAERERQRQEAIELEEAGDIERRLLPREIPPVPGCEISAAWQPARVVGGDYYDVLQLGEGQVGLCIADAIGKGFPAALLMSNLQAAVRAAGAATAQPRELSARLNREVSSHLAPGKFITLFYGLLDASRRRLTYTNAGHNAPILMRRDGSHVRLEGSGAALGVFAGWDYEQDEVELASGDRLVLFTDGVSEAANPDGEEYGEERLLELLRENRHCGAAELEHKVMRAIHEFSSGTLRDDATLIVVAVA